MITCKQCNNEVPKGPDEDDQAYTKRLRIMQYHYLNGCWYCHNCCTKDRFNLNIYTQMKGMILDSSPCPQADITIKWENFVIKDSPSESFIYYCIVYNKYTALHLGMQVVDRGKSIKIVELGTSSDKSTAHSKVTRVMNEDVRKSIN